MTTIYQVSLNLNLKISEIECSRISETSYWTEHSGRSALDTKWSKSFLNKQDAIDFLEQKLKSKIYSCKLIVDYYESQLKEFKELYPCPTT